MNIAEIILLPSAALSLLALLAVAKMVMHELRIEATADNVLLLVLTAVGMILPVSLITIILTVGITLH